jgi:hypothetical protein
MRNRRTRTARAKAVARPIVETLPLTVLMVLSLIALAL